MKVSNDYSFLAKRIDYVNIETAHFQHLVADKIFVKTPSIDNAKRDSLLLNFEQRIWQYDKASDRDNIHIFNSFHKQESENQTFYMHDIYLKDVAKSSLQLELSCSPTLSFRTLVLNDQTHIKFGLPVFYGNMIRLLPIEEALTSMFISDHIKDLPYLNTLDFFLVDKCYYYNDHKNYSILHRTKGNAMKAMPVGNFLNKILNYKQDQESTRFIKALEFVKEFMIDYNVILEDLFNIGLGLEVHGQNLLVYINNEGESLRKYLYRDFGHCTLTKDRYHLNRTISNYYKEMYDFEFVQIASCETCAWQSYRSFVLGFLLYNLHEFQRENQMNFNVYEWGSEIIMNSCSLLKNIY